MKRLFFTLSILLVSVSAHAETEVSTVYNFYPVKGKSIRQIKSSIRYNAPLTATGDKFAATTNYDIFWKHNFKETTNGCRLESIDTKVIVHYSLPKLDESQQLDELSKSIWNDYYKALYLHEQGHARFGIQAAKEIEETLPQITEQTDCNTIFEISNALGKEILRKYHLKNIDYDQETHHGHTQGANLKVSSAN